MFLCGRRVFLRVAILTIALEAVVGTAHTQRLAAMNEANATGDNLFEFSFTPLSQYAIQSGEDTGSYELDVIGSLLVFEGGSSLGAGRVVFFARALDNIGGLQSASEMAENAGLLWPTNDVDVSEFTGSIPLLAWSQRLAGDRLRISAGKLWPQLFFVKQRLTGDNPSGFMSQLISNDMAARYYDLTGLGVFAEYSGTRWFVRGSFSDAQSDREFDLSSFTAGHWSWVAEGGWKRQGSNGTTSLSLLISSVDDTLDVEGETAHSFAFSHDLAGSKHSLFGRYTYRRGGAPLTERGISIAKPLDRSAFVAWAWDQPFGLDRHLLAAALLYGEPIEFTDALGFDIQYGLEVFWKVRVVRWLEITPDLQLIRNKNDDLEMVPGLRLRVAKALEF